MVRLYRSSKTGRTVTKDFAKKHLSTTEAEAVKHRIPFLTATNWARVGATLAIAEAIQPDGKIVTQDEHNTVLRLLREWFTALEFTVGRGDI